MSSLTLKGKSTEQAHVPSPSTSAPLSSTASNTASVMNGTSLTPMHKSSSGDMMNQPVPESPTSTNGWGELKNGIHEDLENDKDGWDELEPLEDPKHSPVLANIQAAQKRPVIQPKPQATSLQPKGTSKMSIAEDDVLWGFIAAPAPKLTSKPLNSTRSGTIDDDDPWASVAAAPPKTSLKPPGTKSSDAVADDDPWAAIATPLPTTRAKPLSAGRGRGTKPAALRLGTSSGM